VTESQEKDRAKDRNRRHQQNQYTDIQIPDERAVSGKRSPAHYTLSRRRFCEQSAQRRNRQGNQYQTCWSVRFAEHAANPQ